jgi:hypothetical protein
MPPHYSLLKIENLENWDYVVETGNLPQPGHTKQAPDVSSKVGAPHVQPNC